MGNTYGLVVHETQKSAVSLNEFVSWADFLNANTDEIFFLSLTFKGSTAVAVLVYLLFICLSYFPVLYIYPL